MNDYLNQITNGCNATIIGLAASCCIGLSGGLVNQPEVKFFSIAVGGGCGALAIAGWQQSSKAEGISWGELSDKLNVAYTGQRIALISSLLCAAIAPNNFDPTNRFLNLWYLGGAVAIAKTARSTAKTLNLLEPIVSERFDQAFVKTFTSAVSGEPEPVRAQQLPPAKEPKQEVRSAPVEVAMPSSAPEPMDLGDRIVEDKSNEVYSDFSYDDYLEDIDADENRYAWINDLLEYPCVLIWGPQGSGKSTLAMWLCKRRAKNGHQLEILNPHYKAGEWKGFKVYGKGMNYAEVDRRLGFFNARVTKKYEIFAEDENFNPRPYTTLCEEFTKWSNECENSAEAFKSSMADIRKINEHFIYVSHNRTIAALGGAKGMKQTIDDSMLEVKLNNKIDPVTRKATYTGTGTLKYPGTPLKEAIPIEVPPWLLKEAMEDLSESIEQEENSLPDKDALLEEALGIPVSAFRKYPLTQDGIRILPEFGGAYLVRDTLGNNWYAGHASDIFQRWNYKGEEHHKLAEFAELARTKGLTFEIWCYRTDDPKGAEADFKQKLVPILQGQSLKRAANEIAKLEESFHQPLTDPTLPDNWVPPNPGEITPELRAIVLAFYRAGKSQNETVPTIWQVAKSGKPPYTIHVETYRKIIKESGGKSE